VNQILPFIITSTNINDGCYSVDFTFLRVVEQPSIIFLTDFTFICLDIGDKHKDRNVNITQNNSITQSKMQ